MSIPTDGEVRPLQHEVERLLGRCLLRLQRYEALLKTMLAGREIGGGLESPEALQATRADSLARMTLGTLAGELFGSYIVRGLDDPPRELADDAPDSGPAFRFRMRLGLRTEDYDRDREDLRAMVELRNGLVHHFLDRHDLKTGEGCRDALDDLIAALDRIERCFESLRGWAGAMVQVQGHIAAYVQTDEFRTYLIDGIAPDGTVFWPGSGIVQALREAAAELAVEGWTDLAAARRWIADRYPDQSPEKYGCKSWQQVVHESRVFELCYVLTAEGRTAHYRPRRAVSASQS